MVSSKNDKQQLLMQLLEREVNCTSMLLQSLDEEYAVLSQKKSGIPKADAIEAIIRVKQERIQQLELISAQREREFSSFAGVEVNNSGAGTQLYQFNGNQALSSLWKKLVNLAEKCRDKNRVNGGIVELASRQSRQALDILQGIMPETTVSSELYDNMGQSTKFSNRRILKHV